MKQGSPEFHAERLKGIGGSDAPVVLNVSPWKSRRELWEEKVGLRAPEDLSDNSDVRRGVMYEDFAAEQYQKATGREFRIKPLNSQELFINAEHSWLRGNPDREIWPVNDFAGPGILEIKCPRVAKFHSMKLQGIPSDYLAQMHHYMMVTGYQWGSFAIWSAEEAELLPIIDVAAHAELHGVMFDLEQSFWQHVLDQTPPPDEPEIKVDIPAVGADPKFLKAKGEEWERMMGRLSEGHGALKEAQAYYDQAKLDSSPMVGDNEIVEGCGGRISFKWGKGRKLLNEVKLKEDWPDLQLDDYKEEGERKRVYRFTPKKGE